MYTKICHISFSVYKILLQQFHSFVFLIVGKKQAEIRQFEDLMICLYYILLVSFHHLWLNFTLKNKYIMLAGQLFKNL